MLNVTYLGPILIPQVATTFLGGSVTFTCVIADVSMLTTWQTELLPVQYTPSNSINATLTSHVDKIEYNNTSVWCISMYPGYFKWLYESNAGKILIQGTSNDFPYILLYSHFKRSA